jgi:hypothetical protein
MKMKITPVKENFDFAVFYILNELERKRLPYPDQKIVDYTRDINIRHMANFLFGMELDAIKFLKKERVIEEIGEPDIIENNKKGTPDYQVEEVLHFKILKNFSKFYEEYKKRVKQHEGAGGEDNTLFFNINGEISYITPTGETFEGKLKMGKISYNLLYFLANQANKKFEFTELAQKLINKPRAQSDPTDERRVRDTVGSIKKALKSSGKRYYGDDLFISDKGFGIKCRVHIVK